MNGKLKRILSTLLIIAMVMTSTGFGTFADGISEMTGNSIASTDRSEHSRYYKEFIEEQTITNVEETNSKIKGNKILSSNSEAIDEEDLDYEGDVANEYEEEPEGNESISAVEKNEEDESTSVVEKNEEDESTTVEKEEETTTVKNIENEETSTVELSTEETTSESSSISNEEKETTIESSETTTESTTDTTNATETINITETTKVIEASVVETATTSEPSEITNNDIEDVATTSESLQSLDPTDVNEATSSEASNAPSEGSIDVATTSEGSQSFAPTDNCVATNSNILDGTSILSTKSEATFNLASLSELKPISSVSEVSNLYGALPSTIWFGTWPQNDITGVQKEPVKWRVISQDADKALLVSDMCLTRAQWEGDDDRQYWKDSDIRMAFLTTYYLDNLCTATQSSLGIKVTHNRIEDGTIVDDKFFLLSRAEANAMGNDADRVAGTTTWARGTDVSPNNVNWWLRDLRAWYYPYYINRSGAPGSDLFQTTSLFVRPAFNANLSSPIFQSGSRGVTWQMNGSSFKPESVLWSQMDTYVGGQKLPNNDNMTPRGGCELVGWRINNSSTVYTEIPENQTGDITLSPAWAIPLRQNWYNTAYSELSITNINFVDAPEPTTGYNERFVMNAADGTYAYRTGSVINIYAPKVIGIGDWNALFMGFRNLQSIDFSKVNTRKVTNMNRLFGWCNSLTTITFGSNFNTASVSDMRMMFINCSSLTSFNLPDTFNTSNVTDMSSMFSDCYNLTSLTLPDTFNTSNVTDMSSMFEMCQNLTSLTLPDTFNTGNLTDMNRMFYYCESLPSLTLPNSFNTSNVTNMEEIFYQCQNLTSLTLPDTFNTSNVTNMRDMFSGCTALTNVTGTNLLINAATNIGGMFGNCTHLTKFDFKGSTFANVTDARYMFSGCSALTELKINSNFRGLPTGATSTNMFSGCTNLVGGAGTKTSLPGIDVTGTYARVDYGGILPGYFTCSDNTIYNNVNISIDNTWANNVTKANIKKIKFTHDATIESVNSSINVPTTIDGIAQANSKGYLKDSNSTLVIHFANAIPKLKTVASWDSFFKSFTNLENIEGLSLIDTSVVTSMKEVFKDCSKLTTVALGDIDISHVTTIESVFENCTRLSALTGNIGGFAALQSTKNAFKNCTSLTAFGFNVVTSNVLTNTSGTFASCSNLSRIIVNDNFQGLPASVIDSSDMFLGCVNLVGGQGFAYNQVSPITDGSVANVDYGGIKPGYFTIQDTSKYDTAIFTLPTNWYDLHAAAVKPKSEITTIKFYNDATGVGTYDSSYYMSDTDRTRFYIDNNTVKIHYGHNMPKLNIGGDWSGFFKDFTNLETIEGLEDEIDLTAVTNMSELFSGCTSLRNISFNPNTPNVTNMEKVFYNCASLSVVRIGSNLNLAKVVNLESAFENCRDLRTLDIGIASFSSVQNLKKTFKNCESLTVFKFDVCSLDHLQTLEEMFNGCKNLTTIYVSEDFPGVTDPSVNTTNMFLDCNKLVGGQGFAYENGVDHVTDGTVARVDYGGIKPGYYTIYGTEEQVREKYAEAKFNLPSTWFDNAIAGGIVGGAVDKDSVAKIKFYNDPASGTNVGVGHYDGVFFISTTDNTLGYWEKLLDASGNDTGKKMVKMHFGNLLPGLKVGADFSGFFKDFKNVKEVEGLSLLNLSDVEDMSELFSGCENLESVTLTPNISKVRDMDKIFYNCKNLTSVDLGENVNLGKVETLESAFENCEKLTTEGFIIRSTVPLSHIKTFKNAFKNCKTLTAFGINAGSADTLTNLEGVFSGCENLTTVNAQSMNFTNVDTTKEMFSGCIKLKTFTVGNNSNFAKISNLEKMFYNCDSIVNLPAIHITSDRVTTMKEMFASCSNITKVGIVSAKTDNLVSDGFVRMFSGCKSLTTAVFGKGFVLGNATDLRDMFNGCENLTYLDLSSFSSNKVQNVSGMFKNNKKLTTIVASNSFAVKGKNGLDMFLNCDSLVGGGGTAYSEAKVNDSSYAQVDGGKNNPGYFTWSSKVSLTFSKGNYSGVTGTMEPMEVDTGVPIFITCKYQKKNYSFYAWMDEDGNRYKKNEPIIPYRPMTLTVVMQENAPDSPGGSGGGGGGGGRGGTLSNISAGIINLNFVVHTPIAMAEYRWVYDVNGERVGVEIRKDSNLGKTLIKSQTHVGRWQDTTDANYIKLKNGFYNMEYAGATYYFGIDSNSNLITGFIQTTEPTEHVYVDITNYTFINAFSIPSGKYFLYNGSGLYRGVVWNAPIVLNNVLYTFDTTGRVIKEENMIEGTLLKSSKWEYDPVVNKWKYYYVDATGRGDYYKNGVFPIEYLGMTNYYSFDSNGYMETGLKEMNGSTYYLQETGNYAGAVYIGKVTLNGKEYEFDTQGRMVSAMTGTNKQ